MPREPYGYAHGDGKRALIFLRNPWIAPCSLPLKLDENVGLSPGAAGLEAISIYPEPRLYGSKLRFGDRLDVPLAPYECVMLSVGRGQPKAGVQPASEAIGGRVKLNISKRDIVRHESTTHLRLEGDISVSAPQSELLVLLEDKAAPAEPERKLLINGKEQAMTLTPSTAQWAASGMALHEFWLFLRAPLSEGKQAIALDVTFSGSPTISAWVWATKQGGDVVKSSRALPSPELISLDAAALLEPTDAGAR